MQAKIRELEASLATVTSALQQLSTQQAVHSAPKPPKPPMPDKFQGDRRSGAASNWLHQMTLYLTLLGLLDTAQAVPHAVSFLIGAARTWWRAQEASGSPPTTWPTFKAAFLEAFQTLDAERIARDNMEDLRQRTSVTDYANHFSGLLLEVPYMHPADAIYQFVKGLKPQIRLHVELQRPATVNNAMRLAQAADSALYHTQTACHVNRPTPSPLYLGPQPMQLGALTRRPPTERQRLLRGNQSFRCHQPGHRAQERTSTTTTRPTPASTQQQSKD